MNHTAQTPADVGRSWPASAAAAAVRSYQAQMLKLLIAQHGWDDGVALTAQLLLAAHRQQLQLGVSRAHGFCRCLNQICMHYDQCTAK